MSDQYFWIDGELRFPDGERYDGDFSLRPRYVGGFTVLYADGSVGLIGFDGIRLTIPSDPLPALAVRAGRGSGGQSNNFLILRGSVIEHRDSAGRMLNTYPLPKAKSYGDDRCFQPSPCPLAEVRLADFEGWYVVYVHGRAIHLVDTRTGKDLVVQRPREQPVHPQLEPSGLTYSHGSKISFFGQRKIDALFR